MTLNKWPSLWKTYHLLRLKTQENLNRLITSKDTETVIKISQKYKNPGTDVFTEGFCQKYSKLKINFYFQNLFKNLKETYQSTGYPLKLKTRQGHYKT